MWPISTRGQQAGKCPIRLPSEKRHKNFKPPNSSFGSKGNGKFPRGVRDVPGRKLFGVRESQREKPRCAGLFSRPAKRGQLLLQTVIVFISASASVRVLNTIGPT